MLGQVCLVTHVSVYNPPMLWCVLRSVCVLSVLLSLFLFSPFLKSQVDVKVGIFLVSQLSRKADISWSKWLIFNALLNFCRWCKHLYVSCQADLWVLFCLSSSPDPLGGASWLEMRLNWLVGQLNEHERSDHQMRLCTSLALTSQRGAVASCPVQQLSLGGRLLHIVFKAALGNFTLVVPTGSETSEAVWNYRISIMQSDVSKLHIAC